MGRKARRSTPCRRGTNSTTCSATEPTKNCWIDSIHRRDALSAKSRIAFMAEDKQADGLRGITAATTALSAVGASGDSLHYRGYDIVDLTRHAVFEEVAYLLLYGKLPTRDELDAYLKRLHPLRQLPLL